jgi:hypothetical protein
MRKGIIEAGIDQEVPKAGVVYAVYQHVKIARRMIASSLLGAGGIEIEARVHMDHAGSKGVEGNVAWVRQHIVPAGKPGRRDGIWPGLELTEAAAE